VTAAVSALSVQQPPFSRLDHQQLDSGTRGLWHAVRGCRSPWFACTARGLKLDQANTRAWRGRGIATLQTLGSSALDVGLVDRPFYVAGVLPTERFTM